MKELRIPHDEIRDPQSITQRNVKAFRDAGLDIHRQEVVELLDDHRRKERVLKVQDRKYFDLGRGRKKR